MRPLTLIDRAAPSGTRARVYGTIRDAIVRGEFRPGDRVSENDLAARLGVSRTPIREALAALREERLVEVAPQLGTFVTRVSMEGVRDAQFVRESLECAAVRLAAGEAGDTDIAALESVIERQRAARDEGDHDRFYVLDDEFHAALGELSGHPIAWSLSQRANGHLNRVRRLSMPQPDYLAQMVAEHEAVVAAIDEGDPDRAEDAMRMHLRGVLSALPLLLEKRPEFFAEDEHG